MSAGFIYAICNKLTGRQYVGQTVLLRKRETRHFSDLEAGRHHCEHLQHSYSKHGRNAFDFVILEACEVARLVEREQHWMDRARIGQGIYNSAPAAGSVRGIKRTPEHRAKISEALRGRKYSADRVAAAIEGRRGYKVTEETRQRLSAVRRGKPRSPETVRKMSAAMKGRVKSAEHRAKLSEAAKRRYAACRP